MPNVDGARGLQPVNNAFGTVAKLEEFQVTASTSIYQGQPVALADTGLIVAGSHTNAVTGAWMGVAAHAVTSAQADKALQVYIDIEQEYEIQSDDATITALTDYKGALFRLANIGAGSVTLLNSQAELDGSSATSISGKAATNVTPLRIERTSAQINNILGASESWTKFIVKIIPPVMHRGMASVGTTGAATNVFTGLL